MHRTLLKTTLLITIIFSILSVYNPVFAKEIVDEFNHSYESDPGDPALVKFVRIRGKKVPIYDDITNREIIQYLDHKQFVQFIEKSGKYCKVRVFHPDGNYEGWINKFKVFNTNGLIKFFFGKPFLMISDEKEIDPADVEFEVNKTSWVIKDKSQLLELPKIDSSVKFDIYFGKELFVKKQKGDYYLVEIPNTIKEETITGWVRVADVGNKEFYFEKYDRSMAEFTRENNSLSTEISELEKYIVELNEEMEDLENEHQMLIFQKEANEKILANSIAKRKNFLIEEKKIAEQIEELVKNSKSELADLRTKNLKLDKEIENVTNDLFQLNAEYITMGKMLDQCKNELPSILPKLKEAYEQKKVYYLANKEEIDKKLAEEAQFAKEKLERERQEKEKKKEPEKDTDQEHLECQEFEKLYKDKIAEFEKVKDEMSKGDISKSRYEELYEQYTQLWNEASQCKKNLKECEFNLNSKHKSLYNEAIALKKEDELEDALTILLEAVELKDDFEEAYFQIVLILIDLDEDTQIDQYLNRISDEEMRGKLINRRAGNIRNNDPQRAIKYYQEMANYYKPELAYYYIGLIYIEKYSDQKNAIKYFKKSLAKDPKDPKVYEALGAAVMETKAPKGQSKNDIIEEAIDYFEKGIKYGDDYKNLHILCARTAQAYNELGKYKSALKFADMSIENANNDDNPTGFLEKGKALLKIGNKKEAEKYLNKAKNDLLTKDQAIFWLKELNK
ncbi:MAG: hypothetical protein JXR69_10340 [Candidatus Delongbacteria bacterium]|nr:hypothetical protein [Candidatus Delongbacteria bacterium]